MTEPGTPPVIGVIGGSGLYEIDGLSDVHWKKVESPFGDTSDEFLFGELDGQKLVFLPRHGRGHKIPPSELNFRANIDALKRTGVTEIISLSACGSFKEELEPGTFVIIDQFIDRTFAREKSFFWHWPCSTRSLWSSGLREIGRCAGGKLQQTWLQECTRWDLPHHGRPTIFNTS